MSKRIGNLLKGIFSSTMTELERKNPEGLLEVEQENLRKQVVEFNQGIADQASYVEKITANLQNKEQIAAATTERINILVAKNERAEAAKYALELEELNNQIKSLANEKHEANEFYTALLEKRDSSVGAAQARIDELKKAIHSTKMNNTHAEITEMASKVSSHSSSTSENLARLEQMVEDEQYKSKGRLRVAEENIKYDAKLVNHEVSPNAKKALEENALDKFLASQHKSEIKE